MVCVPREAEPSRAVRAKAEPWHEEIDRFKFTLSTSAGTNANKKWRRAGDFWGSARGPDLSVLSDARVES